eukprot:evm.model.scf_527.3 EVM.evm.TU.scf_527.3   scf_527:26768-30595(+)
MTAVGFCKEGMDLARELQGFSLDALAGRPAESGLKSLLIPTHHSLAVGGGTPGALASARSLHSLRSSPRYSAGPMDSAESPIGYETIPAALSADWFNAAPAAASQRLASCPLGSVSEASPVAADSALSFGLAGLKLGHGAGAEDAGRLGLASDSAPGMSSILPSGPRRRGEGVQDVLQEIVSADCPNERSMVLKLTLLVAGFVIGPSGASVRGIIMRSGCEIQSWTQPLSPMDPRKVRVFVLQGSRASVAHATAIIEAAVERYKSLAEGQHQGQVVDRIQTIAGVEFHYVPPPLRVAPYAAAVRRQSER